MDKQLCNILNILPQPAFVLNREKILWCNGTAAALHISELTAESVFSQAPALLQLCAPDSRLQFTLELPGQSCVATAQRLEDGILVIASPVVSGSSAEESLSFSDVMRRPLQELISAAETLFAELPDKPSVRTAGAAAELNRAIYRLQRLCTHGSESGRLLAENGTAQRRLRCVTELLDSFAQTCQPLLRAAGYSLQYNPLSYPIHADVDSSLLERALYQLLANALTYAPKGSSLHLHCEKQDRLLLIHLEDQGEGIRPEVLAGLYTQAKRHPSADPRSGLGLGLPLVKRIAELHGGSLTLYSGNKGTVATLSISLVRSPISLRSVMFHTDPYGGRSHALVELADILPATLYNPEEIES